MKKKSDKPADAQQSPLPEKIRQKEDNDRLVAAAAGSVGPEEIDLSAAGELNMLQEEVEKLDRELQETIVKVSLGEKELMRSRDEVEDLIRLKNKELSLANGKLQVEIVERRNAEERILQQNEFLNQVIESLTHPFYVIDASDYTIKVANSAAKKGELSPGITCYALTQHRDTPCTEDMDGCPLQLIKKTKKPITVSHIHFDAKGDARDVEVHGYPIFDEQGNVAQMIEYSLDVTERKNMERELSDTADRIKNFAYAISHDLKSPMIGVLGLTRILHKKHGNSLNGSGRKICEQILKGVEQMEALVEGINAYIKSKETVYHFEQMNPLEIICSVRDEFAPLLSLRKITLNRPAGMPYMFMDRMSVIRVFRNLLDNALKYGGKKMKEIIIRYQDDGEFHLILVSDDGMGIEQEEMGRIFERFCRQNSACAVEGSGLGLAIVREIMEKHHGKVWADSGNYSRGATFYLAFPKKF
jgi:signal transduction histidine kinase